MYCEKEKFYRCLVCLAVSVQFLSFVNAQQTSVTKYFLDKAEIQVKPFSLQSARNGQLITSSLDEFRDLYAALKNVVMKDYYRDYELNYRYIVSSGKVQKHIDPDEPFPCSLENGRSIVPPNSVHKLRPGDIDIIGAMGDSLTAGSAMMARTFLHAFAEFRGQTALGGGLKDWRTFLTLPNILKAYNPNLYGFAEANTFAKFHEARFNVAEPFAITQDMPYMAEVLIKRMQSDPKVNMTKHWKMISILIGPNDICNQMCYYDKQEDFLESHRQDLYKTLAILRDNIKRLMVNIIIVPNIANILRSMRNIPAHCITLQKASCSCLIGNSIGSKQLEARQEIIQKLQQIDMDVAALPEFQMEEFAVVPRLIATNLTLRMRKDGSTDLKYFAIDCFHFSQYGNAAFSTILWNEMLQVKSKPTNFFLRPFEMFACPSEDKPYLSTLRNS